jgi:uncharacterized protein YqeY
MSLEEQIQQDLKEAMKAKDTVGMDAIRGIKSEILLAKSAVGDAEHKIEDSDIMKIVQKMVKQRKESADIYVQQKRQDLADNETAQMKVLEKYLPKQLSADEIEATVKQVISEVGAKSVAEMGKVMGAASKKLAGMADGKTISEIVKKVLGSFGQNN